MHGLSIKFLALAAYSSSLVSAWELDAGPYNLDFQGDNDADCTVIDGSDYQSFSWDSQYGDCCVQLYDDTTCGYSAILQSCADETDVDSGYPFYAFTVDCSTGPGWYPPEAPPVSVHVTMILNLYLTIYSLITQEEIQDGITTVLVLVHLTTIHHQDTGKLFPWPYSL
jgi:hypothetical protein